MRVATATVFAATVLVAMVVVVAASDEARYDAFDDPELPSPSKVYELCRPVIEFHKSWQAANPTFYQELWRFFRSSHELNTFMSGERFRQNTSPFVPSNLSGQLSCHPSPSDLMALMLFTKASFVQSYECDAVAQAWRALKWTQKKLTDWQAAQSKLCQQPTSDQGRVQALDQAESEAQHVGEPIP